MARGGYRPGAGRPKKAIKKQEDHPSVPPPSLVPAVRESKDPLTYMLDIMNDPTQDQSRRDRMAQAAAQYVHPKAGEGKKESREEAARKAAKGERFSPSLAPRALVN